MPYVSIAIGMKRMPICSLAVLYFLFFLSSAYFAKCWGAKVDSFKCNMSDGAGWVTVTSAKKDGKSQDVTERSILPLALLEQDAKGPRLMRGTSFCTARFVDFRIEAKR